MSNKTRNTAVDGTNKSRGGLGSQNSHLWDENNTPWDPDTNLPWEDEALTGDVGFPEGVNKIRNQIII